MVDEKKLQALRDQFDPEVVAAWMDEVEAFRHAPRETPPPRETGLLTTAEVAERLNVSRERVYELLHSNQIRNIRVGRNFRVPPDAVDEWVLQESSRIPPWQRR